MPQVHLNYTLDSFWVNIDAPDSMLEPSFQYGGSFLLDAVQAIQKQDNTTGGAYDKLQQYLNSQWSAITSIVDGSADTQITS